VPGNERDLHAGHLLCDRHCLLRIARVVADFQFQLLAEQATGRVDIGNGQFSAVLELLAEARLRTGHRAYHGNTDVLGHGSAGQDQACAEHEKIFLQRKLHHILLKGLGRFNASLRMSLPESDDHPGRPFSCVAGVRLGRTRRGLDLGDIAKQFEPALQRTRPQRLIEKGRLRFQAFQRSGDCSPFIMCRNHP
jgi:hypothetical protein